jgi:hypothetical protein
MSWRDMMILMHQKPTTVCIWAILVVVPFVLVFGGDV